MRMYQAFLISCVACATLAACGGSSSSSGSSNTAPVAAAGSDNTATTSVQFTLDGSGSSDADNDTLSYVWSISTAPTDSSATLSSTSIAQPTFTPDVDGTYVFSLVVNDGTVNSSADTVSITATSTTSDAFSIYSDAFKDTGSDYFNLPLNYTCDGAPAGSATVGGISPQISWLNIHDDAASLALVMHTNDDASTPIFTVFNIPTSVSTLPEGDFSIGTAATGDMDAADISAAGDTPYAAPCTAGSGIETLYTFTLYALSSELSLTSTATQAQVIEAAQAVSLESSSLITKRIRFDATAIANDDHVPVAVPSTCAEKSAHFNEYSRVHDTIECDTSNNQMDIVSHIASGLKTPLDAQQIQVGIQRWIGRLSLPSQTGHSIAIEPTFLTGVNNNLACDGVATLGITVDGQVILPYYKQGGDGGSSSDCGPTDGTDYSDRDTVVLGEVDQCYGHSPNGEGYHMHGAPVCLMDVHNPSKPIAYMTDGIPLYYGQGGGTITSTTHAVAAESNGHFVTDLNYGGGLYEHLDYRPSDVIDGSNPLNECNAYDINGDGTTSGYVYYTSKDAPYTIGCYMGEPLTNAGNPGSENTRLVSEREGFNGQDLGEAMEGEVILNTTTTFNDKSYNMTEFVVSDTSLSFLEAGANAQMLWRVLDSSDAAYNASTTCFEFRYRKDKTVTDSDETETICSEASVPATTLNFSPFDSVSSTTTTTSTSQSFKLEAWSDNWFAAYSGETLIVEDSVSITTERSFNAETATFTDTYPITLNVIMKDFKENDTGLEYIGENNQQMGDGGFIAQITDTDSNQVIAVSNSDWKCDVIHEAPLDTSCENESNPVAGVAPCTFTSEDEPSDWKDTDYNDSAWSNASEYSEADVSPKAGYDEISWDSNAQLIWGPDLETNNTLLCRITIEAP